MLELPLDQATYLQLFNLLKVIERERAADLADAFRRMVASVRFLRQRGRRSIEDDDDLGVRAAS
jgi:hypothetical protein